MLTRHLACRVHGSKRTTSGPTYSSSMPLVAVSRTWLVHLCRQNRCNRCYIDFWREVAAQQRCNRCYIDRWRKVAAEIAKGVWKAGIRTSDSSKSQKTVTDGQPRWQPSNGRALIIHRRAGPGAARPVSRVRVLRDCHWSLNKCERNGKVMDLRRSDAISSPLLTRAAPARVKS